MDDPFRWKRDIRAWLSSGPMPRPHVPDQFDIDVHRYGMMRAAERERVTLQRGADGS